MTLTWQNLPERSSLFWLRVITWITLHLGRGVARILLYPITLYFMSVKNKGLKATRTFLRKALQREPSFIDLFTLYHNFAGTLLDRLAVLTGRDHLLNIEAHHFEILQRYADKKQACLLVGSHHGSFEILRALGRLRRGIKVKALMYGEATPDIVNLYRSLNPELHQDIITVNGPAALIGLEGDLREGQMLALLADRCMPHDKRIQCDFFDGPIELPTTPVMLSHILKLPMIFFVCLRTGWGRYSIHFEELGDASLISRDDRHKAAQDIMGRYAERLEHYARRAPHNWFNFHDIWDLQAP
ncbi:MAG: lipid A biosynthesis acyltransferase [Methylococcus sp.]|nr:MAG: lipid A biosynthesis acyltransferase [Methylococcus sp.]